MDQIPIMKKVRQLSNAAAKQYLTVDEASKILGVKPPVLRNYLYQEKLTTYKFKTLTLLCRKEVEGWRSGG